MKLKKFLLTCMALTTALIPLSISASAVNNTDVNFSIPIISNVVSPNTLTAARVKQDSSSSYIDYTKLSNDTTNASGPYQFKAFIFGSSRSNGTYVDCSSYTWNGLERTPAIVTRGTRGLIRQDVYEKFGYGAYGQIYGTKAPSSTTGTAKGCWSVDSVGSYQYYNHVK